MSAAASGALSELPVREPWPGSRLRTLHVGGAEVALVEQGDGPLALCLHGFPDSPYTWRHLMPRLAEAGYHAVAPFSRGYAPTPPAADGAYQLGALVADAEVLHEQLGDSDAVLIGHDWGALIGYGALAHDPDRWRVGVGLAAPPGDPLAAGFFEYEQLKQAFYMFLCLLPVAELAFAAGDFALIDGLWRDWAPGLDTRQDVANAKACMRDPRHLSAVIGYQRAAFNPRGNLPQYAEHEAAAHRPPGRPVLYLHGRLDRRIPVTAMPKAPEWLGPQGRADLVDEAGHFLHLERPAEVNRRILDWLDRASSSAGGGGAVRYGAAP